MKLVKLNREQYARWRGNRPVLVNHEGFFVRYATEAEGLAAHRARLRGGVVKVREGDIELSFSSDRELMKKDILERNGACRVSLFNGKILCVIRDPNAPKGVARDDKKVHVSPERCTCANWGGRQAGKHHPTCKYNRQAPPEQRGFPAEEFIEADAADVEETKKRVAQELLGETDNDFIPSPQECSCIDWPKPVGADPHLHHPTCRWFGDWNRMADSSMMLCDMQNRELRPASVEEAREAEVSMAETGAPLIQIVGQTYFVRRGLVTVERPNVVPPVTA